MTLMSALVSLNIIKRLKEIGVRKVLGASMGNITKVINAEFIIILFISCLLGAPLGWLMSVALMGSIWDYYHEVTVASVLVSAIILLIASALSIGYKVYSTSRLNPANLISTQQ